MADELDPREAAQALRDKLALGIAELGLSVRTTNCLELHSIYTVEDLLGRRPEELLAIDNFGERTLTEVYASLAKIGFHRTESR